MDTAASQSDLQLPYLETFAKAAELSSFTAAGKSLGMTQAAVSQRIQGLEKVLGVALFDRQSGRVVLTEAGRTLYGYAQRILALHREAVEDITGRKMPVAGDLLLAASSIPGQHLLPAALSIFRTQYPDVHVRATVLDSLAVLDQVQRGKVHLGLVGRKDDSQHLEYQAFATDEMVLVVPEEHPWRRRKQVSVSEFREQPLIVREPGSGSRWCLEQALAASGLSLSDLPITLELGSNESIKEAVLQGQGVAVLSTLAVQKELSSGQLHDVRIKDAPMERTMYAVWDKRRALPRPARVFLNFLQRCPGSVTS
jgi:DNA-binding transcriptional LysR family regulator